MQAGRPWTTSVVKRDLRARLDVPARRPWPHLPGVSDLLPPCVCLHRAFDPDWPGQQDAGNRLVGTRATPSGTVVNIYDMSAVIDLCKAFRAARRPALRLPRFNGPSGIRKRGIRPLLFLSPDDARHPGIVMIHPCHRLRLSPFLVGMALLLASCATEPPAETSGPPPNASPGPVLELLQGKATGDRVHVLVDSQGHAHVFIAAVDAREVYHLVVAPDGSVQRERVASNAAPSSISAAFGSDGKLHLLLDGQHWVREGVSWAVTRSTPWDDAGIRIQAPRLVQLDKGLVWTFLVDGKETGEQGRWEWFGAGGYGAGIVFPWHVSSDKLVIVPEAAVGEPVWYVLDPQDNLDTANSMLAADSNGVLHIVYEAIRNGIGGSSQPRYAEIQFKPPGPGVERGLPDGSVRGKPLYPVRGSPIPVLGIERPFYFSHAAMAVDPESGTVLVARTYEASFVLRNGKWGSPFRLPLSHFRLEPAPAGGDAFHVMAAGKSSELLYLRYTQGGWSVPVELGEKGSHFSAIASNGRDRAFVVWMGETGIFGRWVDVAPDNTYAIPSPAIGSGAGSQGEDTNIPKDLLDFANGKAELVTPGWVTGIGAASAAGTAGKLTKYLHDSEQWEALAREILRNKYGDNLGWYYLGRAAEGMGLCDAAVLYYAISRERSETRVTRCLGMACFGVRFPDVLKDRLLAVETMRAAGKCSTPPGITH